jgi:hypothetical protein
MTVLPAVSKEKVVEQAPPPAAQELEQAPPTQVLVTEQQVLFGTAAAGSVQRTRTTRGFTAAVRVVATALHHLLTMPTAQPRPTRRVIPPRSRSYYETSLVSRERARL